MKLFVGTQLQHDFNPHNWTDSNWKLYVHIIVMGVSEYIGSFTSSVVVGSRLHSTAHRECYVNMHIVKQDVFSGKDKEIVI